MLFRDSVSMLVEEVILAMNGEVTIAELFAKFGRRFAMIIEPDHDQVYFMKSSLMVMKNILKEGLLNIINKTMI